VRLELLRRQPGDLPSAEEQGRREPRGHHDVDVLRHEEEGELEARVLGVEADDLALPSGKSNGVRLHSATAETRNRTAASGCTITPHMGRKPKSSFPWPRTISFRSRVPKIIRIPRTDVDSASS